MRSSLARPMLLALVLAASACRSPADPELIRAEALVTSGAEGCAVGLMIDGKRYEPIGLRPEHTVIGMRLSVEGIVRNRPSICMMGPGLEIVSSAILE